MIKNEGDLGEIKEGNFSGFDLNGLGRTFWYTKSTKAWAAGMG